MKTHISLFVMGLLSTVTMLSAQETQNIFTYKLGDCEVSLLSEGQQNGRTNILIGATAEMLQQYAPEGTFPNATNAFLVCMPDKTILVDAGYGRKLFDNMRSLGVAEDQVDVVLITHMHGDHIGSLLRDGKAAFPNAEVYLAQPEHDYWANGNNENARKVIELYKDKLHLFQPAEIDTKPTPLFAGIKGLAAYGHTPGHTAFLLESNNEKLLIWGDLTHAMAIQMPYPQVAVTYDVNPEKAVAARAKVLEYVSKNKIPIAGMHIAFPGIGKITEGPGEGYVFTPMMK